MHVQEYGLQEKHKTCLELNGIEPKKYGSWARYARLFNWNEKAAKYDEFVARETERELINERVERKKRQMEMLNGFDELVAQRIKITISRYRENWRLCLRTAFKDL